LNQGRAKAKDNAVRLQGETPVCGAHKLDVTFNTGWIVFDVPETGYQTLPLLIRDEIMVAPGAELKLAVNARLWCRNTGGTLTLMTVERGTDTRALLESLVANSTHEKGYFGKLSVSNDGKSIVLSADPLSMRTLFMVR